MKVSILIPCFNAEKWVGQAIQSAIDQTHPEKEIIVVDDGSTDGSLEVIRSFSDRVRWETGPNRGGNVARNRLLELSTGEWVQYLDADDYLLPEKIAHQLRFWSENDPEADVVYSPLIVESHAPDGTVSLMTTIVDDTRSLEELWIRWYVAPVHTTLWKRAALVSIGGWNESMPCCQDTELTLRAIRQGLHFLLTGNSHAVYRVWSSQTVSKKDPSKLLQIRTDLIDQMLAWLQSNNRLLPRVERAAGQVFFEIARGLATHDIRQANEYRSNRLAKSFFVVQGTAVSWTYKLAYLVGGFEASERLERFRHRSVKLNYLWNLIARSLRRVRSSAHR